MELTSIAVAKATHDVTQNIAQFISSVKGALDDGWQVGEDLPVIVRAAFDDLVPCIEAFSDVVREHKEDEASMYKAVAAGAIDIARALIAKG